MNYLKRAWLSVTRRKGKSLLLFGLIFIIANVIAGAISIQQGAQGVEKKIKSSMGALATIELDQEAVEKEYNQNPNFAIDTYVTLDNIKQIGSSPYVKYYDYNLTTNVGSEALTQYVPEAMKEQEESGTFIDDEMSKYYAFQMKGVNYHKVVDIEEKRINLVDGRVLTEEEVTSGKAVGLISKELADLNQLKVGDTLTVANYKVDFNESGDQPTATKLTDYAIEIVGIFEVPTKAVDDKSGDSGQAGPMNDKMAQAYQEQMDMNTVYLPNKVVEEMVNESMAQYAEDMPEGAEAPTTEQMYQPIFVLKQPEDADKFKEENQAYVPKLFKLTTSSDEYDTIAAPVQSITKMAGYVLTIAIAAAILIITLVVLLFLRDRKHELGIYLSFGEKRGKVFGQILFEVLLIAFVAVSISVVTGNLIAKGMSGNLIQQQIDNQSNQGMNGFSIGGPVLSDTNFTTDDVVSAYEVGLSPIYVLIMYAVGMGTVLLATLVPLAYILRLNPKKIMM